MDNKSISNNNTHTLYDFFRTGILKDNPDMEFKPELLEKQIQFCIDRADNYGKEILTESEISDLAYQLGLHDNNYINRKISNHYDFSKQ